MNKDRNTKQTSSAQTQNSFFPDQNVIEDSIKNYKNIPIKYYINESYFLYNKSDLIKDRFITALNKKRSLYHSTKKTENEIYKIGSPEEFLKFYVDKDASKNSLSFLLTNISGDIPKLKDCKIYNFSLTRIGEKRKMVEPIEAVIICAQQNFEISVDLTQCKSKLKMTEF